MRKALILALVVSFCAAATLAWAGTATPNLVGVWTCKTTLPRQTKGFLTGPLEWVVDEQKGHVFHGTLDYPAADGIADSFHSLPFSGVIAPDDRNIYAIYEGDQMSFGDIISKDRLIMHTLRGSKDRAAATCVLNRQK